MYTAGKRTEDFERPTDGTPVIDVDRGGKITWHGPGQLVGYPIIRLAEPIDVGRLRRGGSRRCSSRCSPNSASDSGRVEGRVRRSGSATTRSPRSASGSPRASRCTASRSTSSNSLGAVPPDRRLRHPRRRRHDDEPAARGARWPSPRSRPWSSSTSRSVAGSDGVTGHRRPQAPAARGAQQRDADRAQARVDQDPGETRPRVPAAPQAREGGGAPHRLPGGGLPQHLRVLGGPRGHLPHRRQPVHAPLRLLPDRHRQARRLRHRRAAPGRRSR